MVKRDFGRDLDIGVPTTRSLTRPVEVQNFEGVISPVDNVASKVGSTNLKLTEIEANTALAIGKDIGVEVD